VSLFRRVDIAPFPPLQVDYAGDRRWYITPTGARYASVTSVLAYRAEKDGGLQRWRDRVGPVEAERVMREACDHGTAVHSAVEAMLRGEAPVFPDDRCRTAFRGLLYELSLIDRIHALETPMYSDGLRLAGRCDLIAEHAGLLSVIDFKTALRPKRREWIAGYVLQVSAYAEMYYGHTGHEVTRGVILITNPVTERAQRFVVDTREHLGALRSLVAEFYAVEARTDPQLRLLA
jgi:hypothetical protein